MATTTDHDYGEAINLIASDGTIAADMTGAMVTGMRAVVMRVLGRLIMARGTLFYASSVGENVLDLENATDDTNFSARASRIAAEAERELGVASARCRITRSTVEPQKVTVALQLAIGSSTVGLNLFIVPGQTTAQIVGA